MSRTEQLKRGMVIEFKDHHWIVDDFRTIQSGKQRPTVHVTLRNLKNGHTTDKTLDQLGKLEEVASEHRQMQYLYHTADKYVFMDSESFEELAMDRAFVDSALPILVEGEHYRFLMVGGQPLSLQMPATVEIEVADTAPVEHAGGGSSVHKEAKLASGIVIHVPLFIKTGDRIKIGAEKHDYLGKAHA